MTKLFQSKLSATPTLKMASHQGKYYYVFIIFLCTVRHALYDKVLTEEK